MKKIILYKTLAFPTFNCVADNECFFLIASLEWYKLMRQNAVTTIVNFVFYECEILFYKNLSRKNYFTQCTSSISV